MSSSQSRTVVEDPSVPAVCIGQPEILGLSQVSPGLLQLELETRMPVVAASPGLTHTGVAQCASGIGVLCVGASRAAIPYSPVSRPTF